MLCFGVLFGNLLPYRVSVTAATDYSTSTGIYNVIPMIQHLIFFCPIIVHSSIEISPVHGYHY